MKQYLLVMAMFICLGCSLPKASNPELINKTSIPYLDEMTRPPSSSSDGSLWQDRSMVADLRARGINDLVTIRITESTSAKLKGDVATSRVGANSLKATSYLSKLVPRDGTATSATTPPSSTSTTSTNTSFKGNGTTDRSEVFSSTITTRVVKVLNNGNLIVEGYRDIQLNNETQRLYISGMVNPAQLDTNSSISSSQVAELRLLYGGKGVVDETTKPGYLSRMINLAWPF
jgi:flagellar L-ring protein precursor FlgH